jgi:hypothetical protein
MICIVNFHIASLLIVLSTLQSYARFKLWLKWKPGACDLKWPHNSVWGVSCSTSYFNSRQIVNSIYLVWVPTGPQERSADISLHLVVVALVPHVSTPIILSLVQAHDKKSKLAFITIKVRFEDHLDLSTLVAHLTQDTVGVVNRAGIFILSLPPAQKKRTANLRSPKNLSVLFVSMFRRNLVYLVRWWSCKQNSIWLPYSWLLPRVLLEGKLSVSYV